MGSTSRSTADKRPDCSTMVYGKRHQAQNLLLPIEEGAGTVPRFNTGDRAVACAAAEFGYPHRKERSANFDASKHLTGHIAGAGSNVMLNDLPIGQQVYLVTGYTDLRRSIDGLAMIIQSQLHLDPFCTALFLFCGRRRDRIKGLLWEGDGFLLLYKRLDNGQFQWPRSETEAKLLTPQQTRWLLEGLTIEQPKAIREGKAGAIY